MVLERPRTGARYGRGLIPMTVRSAPRQFGLLHPTTAGCQLGLKWRNTASLSHPASQPAAPSTAEPWRGEGGGKNTKATHIQLQVENQQRLPCFCSGVREAGFCSKRGRKPLQCATKYGTKTSSVRRMGVFTHEWRVCTPHARNHTFKVIGEVYRTL